MTCERGPRLYAQTRALPRSTERKSGRAVSRGGISWCRCRKCSSFCNGVCGVACPDMAVSTCLAGQCRRRDACRIQSSQSDARRDTLPSRSTSERLILLCSVTFLCAQSTAQKVYSCAGSKTISREPEHLHHAVLFGWPSREARISINSPCREVTSAYRCF